MILLQLKYSSSSSEDHQFVRGIPIYAVSQVLEKIIVGASGPVLLINGIERPMPLVRILEVELYPTLLSKARSFGLCDDWVQVYDMLILFIFFRWYSLLYFHDESFIVQGLASLIVLPRWLFVSFFLV